ncbi:iron-siderophore ABC transporter substrate-binding protein [Amycolatopsis sp. PS_44_ISF1]|uniref:iron-siderophore ABC transporter substrate-binding protein n=1 Tax=Amycolatopsis sp. PS_44_ISF1 TaxID=2974917 RepID=UPI0028DE7C06|nr:iron-siderophore ABC transporter substrate-binding protein [Amycolatopsis sp. PS_44_ISF1]MDT8913080.1 iron-siderophore ABC transporter substrate-binding protein [Amycolatopsis sp. PS_44_ISF1]
MGSCTTRTTNGWRRWALVVASFAIGASLLAGCGSAQDGPAASDAGTGAGGTFPVTVEHAFGATTIDRAPKRVVALGYTDSETLLALGVKPLGMTDQYPNPPGQSPDVNTQWPWVKSLWGDAKPAIVQTLETSAPDYEKIASLRPDLIIAVYSEIDKAAYDRLSQIAPTVGRTKTEKELFSAPWQDNARQIGKALGRPEVIEADIKRIDEQVAATRRAHPEFANQTAVALSWYKDSVAPFTSTDVRGRLLASLGFKSVPAIDRIAGDKFYTTLSPERLDLVNVDRIFMIGDAADQQAIKNFPLFANLPAVRAGKVTYLLDSQGPAIGAALAGSTVLSLPYAIDQISQLTKQ